MDKERTGGRPVKRGRKKVCMFCVDRAEKIDYKDIAKLRKCMT
ncbi:MAG TPA: 30S ribosomal protein S18, partial [Ruminococcus sp.]|nr:30S ribosomal protein S18 [Ruminococcus sp.]